MHRGTKHARFQHQGCHSMVRDIDNGTSARLWNAWQKRASRRAAACPCQQAFDVCRLTPRCSGRHPGAFAPGRRR